MILESTDKLKVHFGSSEDYLVDVWIESTVGTLTEDIQKAVEADDRLKYASGLVEIQVHHGRPMKGVKVEAACFNQTYYEETIYESITDLAIHGLENRRLAADLLI